MGEWIKKLTEKYSEVNEKKLTGNQHKLDIDKDGDIDGDDFKHMRNKKKSDEKEKVDEISKDLAGRYIKKAQISTADAGRDTMDDRKKIRDRGVHKIVNRRMGTADAIRKLTGKARVPATEEANNWPVYNRILEKKDEHTKGATPPQTYDDKFSASDKKFADAHGGINGNDSGIDGDKAAQQTIDAIKNSTKPSAKRSNDKDQGDKSIVKSTEAK